MIQVNGNIEALSEQVKTVHDLLIHYNLNPQQVIVELNGHIVDKGNYSATLLHDHDKLELVHFVGGG